MNPSGIVPVDLRGVFLPDPAEKKSAGGVIIPETTQERAKFAAVKATVVALGDNFGCGWGDKARKPKPGDRVLMAQYAGANVKGADGQDYRVCNDEDILAILDAEA